MCSFFFFKQKTAYEMRISDWSSDVCSSDLGFTWTSLVAMLLLVGVLVPFIEEIIFRGLLFGWLRKHLPFLAAAPAAALLFAVAHQVWVLVPVLAFMGLVLAAVTERSGSLWPAIILHGVFNSAMTITYYTALAAGAAG